MMQQITGRKIGGNLLTAVGAGYTRTMKAGRELDVLVAKTFLKFEPTEEFLDDHPFSTDIYAATEVLEIIRHGDIGLWERFVESLRPMMNFSGAPVKPEYWVFLVSPDRICAAALKAAGVGVAE
jgi:hypothetical protein